MARAAAGLTLVALVTTVFVPTTTASFSDTTAATASFAAADVFGPEWWNPDYAYRRAVTVTAAESPVAGDYAVSLTVDHAALVNTGQSLASGDDLRMLHWTGAEWTELDRVLDSGSAWNGSSTNLWFATQTPLGADEADTSYWLYYGNPDAGTAPADPGDVYLFHDDFSSGTLSRWDAHAPVPDDWYDAAWGWRKALTIDADRVEGSGAHSDFPVLVSVTDADLQARAQAAGADILFTSADGVTKLDHEIEHYDATTGELAAWVRVPSLSTTQDTGLYLYYGNPDAGDQQGTGTWAPSFRGVYHLNDTPSGAGGDIRDSSTNAKQGTSANMSSANAADGHVADALDFVKTSQQRVDIGDPGSDTWTAITLSAWVNPRMQDNRNRVICRSPTTTPADHIFCLYLHGGWVGARIATDANSAVQVENGGTVANDVWQHVAATWDAADGAVRIYVDGIQVTTGTVAGSTIKPSTLPAFIGNVNTTDDRYFDGRVDEARLSSMARSAAWLRTEFHNQSAPGAFHTLGVQEASGGFIVASDQVRSAGYSLKALPTTIDRWISAADVTGQADVLVDAWWRLSRLDGMDVGQAVRTPAGGGPLHHYEGQLRWANDADRKLSLARYLDGTWTSLDNPGPQPDHAEETWQRMTVVIVDSRMRLLRDGDQIVPATGWSDVGSDIASGGLGFRASGIDDGQAWWIDDVVARPYVDPEPGTSLGPEQPAG